MFQTLISIISIFNTFFDSYSVATARRSQAIFVNPAGLGLNPGIELFYNIKRSEDWYQHRINLLAGNIGFGIDRWGDTTNYQIGIGFPVIRKVLLLGYAYNLNDNFHHRVGALLRPSRFISFGLNTDFSSPLQFRPGIALRPLTDRITIFVDGIVQSDSLHWRFGGGIEFLPGLIISGQTDLNLDVKFGVELSLARLKLGFDGDNRMKSGGIILSTRSYPASIPSRKKLVKIDIRGSYEEDQHQGNLIGFMIRHEPAFYKLLNRLNELRNRDDVCGVIIKLDDYYLSSAQYDEFLAELLRLKKAGKKIIFFSHQYKSLVEYRLVALADYIILAQLGEIVMPGVWARKSYLKGTLDKLGLETEIDYIGRFKSAHETFSRKDMSEADSIQWSAILDDVYEPAVNDAELGRGFSRAEIESLINRSGYWNSQDAKLNRLIDTTAFFYDVDDIAKKIFDQKVKVVEVNKVLDKKVVSRAWTEKRPKIALVIGEGAIIVGKSGYNPVPIVGGKYIGSETIAKIFEKIRKDKSIKAVVFRINSGGGSALASDIICEAVRRCDKEKPVIVSMGGVAGSGGYYIACQARKILADNSTITGSIGVVSVKIITRRFFDEKIGITYDWIKRGEHIDAFSDLRHFTKEESLHFHQEIEWWYDKFLDRIVQGRKLEKSFVDSIGQGRIWSGRRAKELGLIDENGGLMDAIELAKKEAGIKKDVEIVFYPRAEKRFGINNPAGAQDITRLLSERFLYLMPYDVTIE